MKYLKLFESFEDIDSICEKYKIKNYTINEDGSIDVDGDVDLCERGLTKIPLKFRNVSGNFLIVNNELTSLEGSPKSVGVDFYCSRNKIRTFEGSPINIHNDFYCVNNPIFELWKLFGDKSKIELFNDFGITDGEVVILERLNEFLEMIGEPTLKIDQMVQYKNYKKPLSEILEGEGYRII